MRNLGMAVRVDAMGNTIGTYSYQPDCLLPKRNFNVAYYNRHWLVMVCCGNRRYRFGNCANAINSNCWQYNLLC